MDSSNSGSSADLYPPEAFFPSRDQKRSSSSEDSGEPPVEMNIEANDNDDNDDSLQFKAMQPAPSSRLQPALATRPRSHNTNSSPLPPLHNNNLNSQTQSRANLQRYEQSNNLIRNRISSNSRLPMFGTPPPSQWMPPSSFAMQNGGESNSKIPASLLVIAAVLLILYLFTPSFVLEPSTNPLELGKVSHVHVFLLALGSGVVTFALNSLL